MGAKEQGNPYSAPSSHDEPSVVSQKSGLLARFLVEVVSTVVGVCVWFCTSAGYMAVGFRLHVAIGDIARFLGIALPIPAAVLLFHLTHVKLLPRPSSRRESGEGK
jgi:hypothetical protein